MGCFTLQYFFVRLLFEHAMFHNINLLIFLIFLSYSHYIQVFIQLFILELMTINFFFVVFHPILIFIFQDFLITPFIYRVAFHFITVSIIFSELFFSQIFIQMLFFILEIIFKGPQYFFKKLIFYYKIEQIQI